MNLVNTTVLFCYLLILSRAVDTATSTLSTFGNITASSTTVISTPVIPNSSPTSHEEAGPTNRTYERQVWHFEWFITSDDNTVDAKASNNITRSNTNTADTIGDAEVSENNPASDNITADISSGAVAFVGFQTFKDIPAFAPSGTFGSGGENEYGNIELFRISYVYDGSSSVWDASDFGSAQAELDASIRSNLAGLFENWRNWSSPSNIIQVTPSNNKSQLRPPDPGDITVALANNFSSFEECRQLYDAFDSIFYNSGFLLGGAEFSDALDSIIQARYPRDGSTQIELRCPFGLRQVSDDGTDIKTASKDSCTLRVDDPTAWEYFSVDHNLIAFQQGRIDEDYVRYNYFDSLSDPIDTSVSPFARHNQFRNSSFSTTLRSIMGAGVGLKCTLKNPCLLPPDCAATGTRYYATRGKPIYHSRWSYLAIWAIRNINEQLNNQYVAVKGAAIEATLDTFNIDDYLPKPNKDFGLFNALTGLGAVFGAVGGFLPPVIAPLAGSLGAIIPAVGAEFERSIAADPVYGALVNQKKFAPIVRRIYKNFVDTLDSVATDLLDGKKIGGEADILDMMKDGVWLNPDQLLEVRNFLRNTEIGLIVKHRSAARKTKYSLKSSPGQSISYGSHRQATKCGCCSSIWET